MKAPALRCEALARRLDDGRWLYRGCTLDLGPGLHVVVGPNGSGKSSLLRDLIGLRPLQSGTISLDGRPLVQHSGSERARAIAYLPQVQALPYDRRVEELVMLGRAPHRSLFGVASPDDRKAVTQAMRSCEVEGFAGRGVLSLSGGERQRVMIARLLATEAPTLVLDEPASSLDIGHTLQTYQLLRALADAGHCVIVAMHELDLAHRFADEVILLGAGEGRVEAGLPDLVLAPERVSRVFEVEAQIVAGELRFAAKPAVENSR